MSSHAEHISSTARQRRAAPISRGDALRLAEQKKGTRRLRTRRIRQVVAALAAAAFIGPLGFIWAQSSSSSATTQTTAKATTTQSATTTSSGSTSSGSTSSGSTQTTQSAAPVTTQQS